MDVVLGLPRFRSLVYPEYNSGLWALTLAIIRPTQAKSWLLEFARTSVVRQHPNEKLSKNSRLTGVKPLSCDFVWIE